MARPRGSKNRYPVPHPSGSDAYHWKGGRRISSGGYVQTFVGEPGRRYRFEHEVIAERALGHALPPRACVHHVNTIKVDNSNDNLVICEDSSYHFELHRKMAVQRAGGNPWRDRLCCVCHVTHPAAEFYRQRRKISSFNPNGYISICCWCGRARQAARRERRVA